MALGRAPHESIENDAIGWNPEEYRPIIPVIPVLAKIGQWLSPILLLIFDYLAVIMALLVALRLRNAIIATHPLSIQQFGRYIYIIIPMVYLSMLAFEGMYSKRLPLWQKIEKLFKVALFATSLTTGLIYFEQISGIFSRLFIGLSFVTCFVTLLVTRYLMKHLLVTVGLWKKPALLIGAGRTAELLSLAFREDTHIGYEIVGVFDDNHLRPLIQRYQYLGGLANLEEVIRNSRIQDVLIALPGMDRERLLDLIYRIQPYVRNISIVPDLFGLPLSNVDVSTYFRQKTVTLTLRNNFLNIWNRVFKRIFDLAAGIVIGIFVLPVMLVLTVLVKLDSPGPAFHNARRIGKNGKEFTCFKFRTMYVNGDVMLEKFFADHPEAKLEWDRFAKLKSGDPRVTRVGNIIRKYSLDELPQIFNVLFGNMSLVGPRPYLPREKNQMSFFFDTIVEAKPGITGLWQISGRNDVEFIGRLELDAWYVRNWSFWLDVTMLLKTIKVVFGKLGAY
ncbi:MAG TPA: undecaprenyl-phosphate galactose phosphotransferase WbaP [Bacillota bacterium]|nr:undecaprenyl-phosphate galactose phosphotransferase WbaP [Bacillota bacterium]